MIFVMCLITIIIMLISLGVLYLRYPELIQMNINYSSQMGLEDYDKAEERKRLGMGAGGRLYHRLHDFLTYIRAFTTGRPR